MEFAIGWACGFGVSVFIGWLILQWEWEKRREVERDVRKLMRHLACGAGVVGCHGGPHCKWDHK